MKKQTQPEEKITCSRCGHVNPAWYAACEKCNQRLSLIAPNQSTHHSSQHAKRMEHKNITRPGCITIYSIFLIFFGTVIIIVGFFFASLFSDLNEPLNNLVVFSVVILLAGVYYVTALGLLKLKNRARIGGIFTIGISVLLLNICIRSIRGTLGAGGPTFGIVTVGAVVSWFITNRKYFH